MKPVLVAPAAAFVAIVCLSLHTAPPAKAQSIGAGAIGDSDDFEFTSPGTESVNASQTEFDGSFGTASAQATVTTGSVNASGSANAASGGIIQAFASSNLTVNFDVIDTIQLIYSYSLNAPAAGPSNPLDPPLYWQREAGASLQGGNSGMFFEDIVFGEFVNETSSGSGSLFLVPDSYSAIAGARLQTAMMGPDATPTIPIPQDLTWQMNLQFINGQSQSNPFLPTGQNPNGGWVFNNAPGSRWFDPVMADGFEFAMIGAGSYFTSAGMPVGLGDANGYVLQYMDGASLMNIMLAEGDTWDFPAGVDYFKVLDIDPAFDPDDPLAFPIFLDFSTTTASFSMTPILIPEPSTAALLGLALLVIPRRRRSTSG